jgi:hypothetical protein
MRCTDPTQEGREMPCAEGGVRGGASLLRDERGVRYLLRDEGGGASAEGAIVATFLVMIFSACLFVAESLARGEAAIETARESVWSRALDDCPRGAVDTSVMSALAGYPSSAETISPTYADHFRDVRAESISATKLATATAHESAGGRTVTFTESSETACNTQETEYGTDARSAALRYFCQVHPELLWFEGCDPSVTTAGTPAPPMSAE